MAPSLSLLTCQVDQMQLNMSRARLTLMRNTHARGSVPGRCRGVIQQRPLRPMSVRAASGQHRHAGDAHPGQNASAEMVPEYPSISHQQQPEADQQQHYSLPQYPGPPPQYSQRGASSGGGGLPTLVWVIVGAVIATVVSKVAGVVRSPGGVQGWMMQQAMKQAMKGMGGQAPQPGQAQNPFGGMGGMPGGMPGGFPGIPGQMGQGWPPAVDTTAQPAGAQSSGQQPGANSHQPPYNQDPNKGKRFQEHKAQSANKAAATAASPRSTASSAPAASSPPSSSFVDPPKQAASFRDVGDDEESSSNTASSSGFSDASTAGNAASSGFYHNNQSSSAGYGQQQQQASSSGGKSSAAAIDAMERLLKDPKMQEMLYPHLPEAMRNPQTFEFMMSNPEARAQLEQVLSQQGAFDPGMLDALSSDAPGGLPSDWEEQLKQFNMTPADMVSKIMSEPELAQAFAKPEVQAAVMDISQQPMNIVKYQNNPEIMQVFTKLQAIFPNPGMNVPNGAQQ